jgi:hypothetical protein
MRLHHRGNRVLLAFLPAYLLLAAGTPDLCAADASLELLKAASAGDAAAAKRWIALKANVNYRHGSDKISPLMIAAMRGRRAVFELLLKSGADPNLTDKDGATARNYLALVGKNFSDDELNAMMHAIQARGGKAKELDGMAGFLFVGTKPLSPGCYDFEKAPCGPGQTGRAAAVKPPPSTAPPPPPVAPSPRWNGTWKLNVARSSFGGFPAPDERTEVIALSDAEIVFEGVQEVKAQRSRTRMRYLLDGRSSTNDLGGLPITSTARWEAATLVVRSQAAIGNQGSIEKEDRFTLAADGRTITQVQKILSGKRAVMTMVYERQ